MPGKAELELAWCAGFFDGEGHTGYAEYKGKKNARHARILLSIGQADKELLDRFQAAVGGVGSIGGRYKNKGRGFYRWSTSGSTAQDVMALIWPYLGPFKRAQYLEALEKKVAFTKEKNTWAR